jgi:hypothetical protein
MTESALSIVQKMSDVQAVRFLQHFGDSLFQETSRETILGGVSPEISTLSAIRRLKALDAETRGLAVGPEESARIARAILTEMARDKNLAPVVLDAWKSYKPDELFVEAILASGFVAAMLLFMATTEIEGRVLGLKFKKSAATAEVVRAVTEPFFGVIHKLKGK